MEAMLVCGAMGLLITGLGVYQIVTGNASLLHGYHRATTPPEQLPALARWTGAGLALSGVGCALLGLPNWGAVAGVVLLVGGLGLTLGAIVRFNGALFSFASFGGSPTSSGDRNLVAPLCAFVGVICLVATVVPGTMMLASGDPSLLHGYHLANVAAADLPALARWEGASMVALGVGLFLALGSGALMAARPHATWAKVLLGVGVAVFGLSLVVMLGAILVFNGTLVA